MTLFFTVTAYNIRIFSNDWEMVSSYHISILGNSLGFVYDFQNISKKWPRSRYSCKLSYIKLCLYDWTGLSAQEIFKDGLENKFILILTIQYG